MLQHPTLRNLTNGKFGEPPEFPNSLLQDLGAPHVSSFNYMLKEGLEKAIADLNPVEFEIGSDVLRFEVSYATIENPTVPPGTVLVKDPRIFPSECRQRAATYKGRLSVEVRWFWNGKEQQSFVKDLGEIPIMLRSNKCNLNNMSPKELVKHGEHEQEWGGYFLIKGHERLVRMLVMTRRNFPICLKRSSWKTRGNLFSDMGVSIRCVKEDQTSLNNNLHFVTDGSVKFMFSSHKNLYYVPLILIMKALYNYVDQYIYKRLMQGYEDDLYYSDCIQNMLRSLHIEGLHTHKACKEYIGKMFRVKYPECPKSYTNKQVADYILKSCVLIHLNNNEDKFNMLVFMTQKLFMFVQDKCRVEGADTTMMHELLLGGHLYLKVLKEKIQGWLIGLRMAILKRSETAKFSICQNDIINAAKLAGGIESTMENFLATGNIRSPSGLGLMQDKGLTIVAENINRMRFMSHFKAIHRGSFFQEMRTTEPRQLLPDAWGFICPVHTPDGAPCGLLNHLSLNSIVTDISDPEIVKNIPHVLAELGMTSIRSFLPSQNMKDYYIVQLDGKLIGYLHKSHAPEMVEQLRFYKTEGVKVPYMLEIVLVPFKECTAQYPGLFLFTGPARMMRPVYNLKAGKIEFIGTFEQVYMDICVVPSEMYKGVTTHMEITKTSFMSNLAHLIPMPDCNQSPRNMYQCQMGKQTMGTPCHNWQLQAETKLYRLQTPGAPLFRPVHHDNINMDDFAMGTNAIVAVISYTGYDMEDAIIINKASQERGFAHGSIYKSEFIELDKQHSYFCRDPQNSALAAFLDTDGLPYIGRLMKRDEPLCCFYSEESNRYVVKKFNGKEECYVDNVKLCGGFGKGNRLACVTFRVLRNHFVGDKFASRAGQKGICSQTWPAEDLPFTETGLVPDIIFNPHGFPSRMTIAMMIEMMAGKSAAVHGLVHDATPFRFTEDRTAIDYFGKLLQAAGYDYHGTERMYSGIDGREMSVEIFFGVVHYQRLRHMVSDKWQVRSTGPIDALTRQPVKGRKRGGGVRFGEMERDALLSHGASFLLHDRLFHCSDKTRVLICKSCGSLLGPLISITKVGDKPQLSDATRMCRLCGKGNNVDEIEIPYIFKFFVTQLASCNVNVKIQCKHV